MTQTHQTNELSPKPSRESFDASLDVSVDLSAQLDTLRPPTGKAKKTKKKKRKRVDEEETKDEIEVVIPQKQLEPLDYNIEPKKSPTFAP